MKNKIQPPKPPGIIRVANNAATLQLPTYTVHR